MKGRGLSFVGSGAFTNLTRASGASFALVDLSDNAISTVEDGAFATLRAANLDLSSNSISRAITGAFLRDAHLSGVVDLRYNQLSTIENSAFAGMQLAEMRIDSNTVGTIQSGAFYDLELSGDLTLSEQVVNVEDGAFATLRAANLDLSGNNLEHPRRRLPRRRALRRSYLE